MKYNALCYAMAATSMMAPPALAREELPSQSEVMFLMAAAQEQESAIILGQLATRKALSRDVKQFAAKMIEDHQTAIQGIRRVASKGGIKLPMQVNEKQRRKYQELAKLWDKDFDREYMRHMLRDHSQEVTEFERNAQPLRHEETKRWAFHTLPVLKQHLQWASRITSTMVIDAAQAQLAGCSSFGPTEELPGDEMNPRTPSRTYE